MPSSWASICSCVWVCLLPSSWASFMAGSRSRQLHCRVKAQKGCQRANGRKSRRRQCRRRVNARTVEFGTTVSRDSSPCLNILMERGTSIKVFGLCSALIPLGLSWAASEQAKRSRIVFFGKGDGELMAPDEICGFCLANRTDMPYTDLRPRWRATEIGTTVAFKERLKRPLHPLADAPFFTFWLDIMHLWDCKGVWPLLMGGALWMLVQLMGVANGERWTWRAGGGHLHLPGFIGPAVPVEDLPHWVMIVHEKHFDQLRMVMTCCPRVGPPPDFQLLHEDRRMRWFGHPAKEWQCLTCHRILKQLDLVGVLPSTGIPSCMTHGPKSVYLEADKGMWGFTSTLGGEVETAPQVWAIDDVPVPYNCFKVFEGRIINDDRWYESEKLGQLVEMIE